MVSKLHAYVTVGKRYRFKCAEVPGCGIDVYQATLSIGRRWGSAP